MWSLSGVFDKIFGVVTRVLVEWSNDREVEIRFLAWQGTFHQDVQTGHGTNPAFCPLTTGSLFLASTAARTWSRQFTAISVAVNLCHHFHFSICLTGVVLTKRPTAIQPHGDSTHVPNRCSCGNKQVLQVQCFTDIINNDSRHKTLGSNAVLSWRYIPPPTLAVPSLSVRYSSIMCRLLQPCNTMNDRTKQYVCDRLIQLCIEWHFSR
jgi:hypothetical protein